MKQQEAGIIKKIRSVLKGAIKMGRRKDEYLKEQVQAAINGHTDMKGYDIRADVIDGEVQLSGIVDSLAEKQRLNEIVSQVAGIKRIENGVSIATDGQITDRDVEFEVAEELNADPRVNLKHIGAKSVDGKVFLVGSSDDKEEINAAIKAASKARGVKEVISQVKYQPDDLNLEELFHSQVNNDREEGGKIIRPE